MKKPYVLISIFLLLWTLPCSAVAQMTPTSFDSRARGSTILSTSAELSIRSNGKLNKYVRISYTTNDQTTAYIVLLQRKESGKWKNYSSDSQLSSLWSITYSEDESPPKGYQYRLKVELSSTSFSGIEFYSSALTY